MSPARAAPSGGRGAGRGAITALIVVAIAVGMLLLVRARPGVDAFDPRSSRGDGATGAVLLLQQFGAQVSITAQAPSGEDAGHERVFVISDRLSQTQRDQLLEFVELGGIAVVADPASPLHGGAGLESGATEVDHDELAFDELVVDAATEANVLAGHCTIGALARLRGVLSPAGILFPIAGTQDVCFTDESDSANAFVIVRPLGQGAIIGFGDNRVATNDYLRFADNSGLITSLLAPVDGAVVRIMIGSETQPEQADVGTGNEGLIDLVRPGVWMALSQLALAFVVFCVARGVRSGRVVREPQPTQIAGNELVTATGNIMQRARHSQRAGWLIRGEFYRQLCTYFGTAHDISIQRLAEIASERADVRAEEIRAVLERDVGDAGGLSSSAAEIDRLRARIGIAAGTEPNHETAARA